MSQILSFSLPAPEHWKP